MTDVKPVTYHPPPSLFARLNRIFVSLVIAVVLGWLDYHFLWLRQRREFLTKHRPQDAYKQVNGEWMNAFTGEYRHETALAPFGLWVIGEQPQSGFIVTGLTSKQKRRVQALFPEAEIYPDVASEMSDAETPTP